VGIFSKFQQVKSKREAVYLIPGTYVLECIANKYGTKRAGTEFFAAEFRVVASTNPERPVGSVVSWFMDLAKYPESALRDIKSYVAALTSTDDDSSIGEAEILALTADNQPAKGLKVRATALDPKPGKKFVKIAWSSVQ